MYRAALLCVFSVLQMRCWGRSAGKPSVCFELPSSRLDAWVTRPGYGRQQTLPLPLIPHIRTEKPAALPRPEAGVEAAVGEQFGVGALFDDAALIQHHQPVERGDGG